MTWGATVGVLQQTAHTRTPASFTKVQCSHSQALFGAAGGGPSESVLSSSSPFFSSFESLSLSESASLEGNEGGDGVRCLTRRDARERTLNAGDAALEAARDIARLSAAK